MWNGGQSQSTMSQKHPKALHLRHINTEKTREIAGRSTVKQQSRELARDMQ
jgi:hypothetical protein